MVPAVRPLFPWTTPTEKGHTVSKPANSQKAKRKKQHSKAVPEVNGTAVTVELDGVTIRADFAITQNLRVMRQVKLGNIDAMIDLVDGMFGEHVADLEERFNLVTTEDWAGLIQRVGEAVNPNSRRS